MQLIQTLHRKETNSSVASENSEDKASQNPKVTAATKELTRAEKRSICGKFAQMIREKQLHLTADQHVAVAHWVVQMLEDPDLSDMSSGTTDTHPRGQPERQERDVVREVGNSEKDFGYGGQKDGTTSCGDGKDGDEGNGEIGQHDDGRKILEHVDRACIGQPSDLLQADERGQHATDTAGTGSNEKEPTEGSQAAVGQKVAKAEQKDSGAFNLFDICIALSKGDLDQRRMKRLRDGFLGLLNQSV